MNSTPGSTGVSGVEKGQDAPAPEQTAERWRVLLEKRGVRSTGARRAIFDVFLRSRGHVTLEDIQQLARRSSPHIGLATVYRAMKILETAGLAERHEFQGGASRFEVALGRGHHDHLICTGCGSILEFESPEIERLQDDVAQSQGFEVRAHRHELYGLCAACRSRPPSVVVES